MEGDLKAAARFLHALFGDVGGEDALNPADGEGSVVVLSVCLRCGLAMVPWVLFIAGRLSRRRFILIGRRRPGNFRLLRLPGFGVGDAGGRGSGFIGGTW